MLSPTKLLKLFGESLPFIEMELLYTLKMNCYLSLIVIFFENNEVVLFDIEPHGRGADGFKLFVLLLTMEPHVESDLAFFL